MELRNLIRQMEKAALQQGRDARYDRTHRARL